MTDEEFAKYVEEEHGMTVEEYRRQEEKYKQKVEERMHSNKAKQYKRFMKKHTH